MMNMAGIREMFVIVCLCAMVASVAGQNLTVCESDIIFALDQSTSMRENEFIQMITFSSMLIKTLPNFGQQDGIMAGVLKFSTRSEIQFNLYDYSNAIAAAAATLLIEFDGGITNTHLALIDMQKMFASGRPNIKKFGILITDGVADKPVDTQNEANKIHASGASLAVIAIGKFVNQKLLKPLASSPNLFKPIPNFESLQKIKTEILELVCRTECNKTLFQPDIPSHRQEQNLPIKTPSASIDLLQSTAFQPIIWSAKGLCISNDKTIVDDSLKFAREVLRLLEASKTIENYEKECYRVALTSLIKELGKTIIDCPKIARLMTCALKILKQISETIGPNLVSEGTNLRNLWNSYSQNIGSVNSAADAIRIIGLQEQLIVEWNTLLNTATDASERARIRKLINELQRVVDLNKLKLDYDSLLKSLVVELGKNPRDNNAITRLHNQLLSKLQMMNTASDDVAEKNNIQAAIGGLKSVLKANSDYRKALSALIIIENQVPINEAKLLTNQRKVIEELKNMKLKAGSAVEANTIQTVVDALRVAINTNVLVRQHNGLVAQINNAMASSRINHALVVKGKKQLVNLMKQIKSTINDPNLQQSLEQDIISLEKEIAINEIKMAYNKSVSVYNLEVMKDPVNEATVIVHLNKMIANIASLIPLIDDASQKSVYRTRIDGLGEFIKCHSQV